MLRPKSETARVRIPLLSLRVCSSPILSFLRDTPVFTKLGSSDGLSQFILPVTDLKTVSDGTELNRRLSDLILQSDSLPTELPSAISSFLVAHQFKIGLRRRTFAFHVMQKKYTRNIETNFVRCFALMNRITNVLSESSSG